MRANNNHSHLAIKNFVKLLILVMFLTLFAKIAKKRGKARGKGVRVVKEESKPASTFVIKIFKEAQKNHLTFARSGKMLTTLYIYNIIYNII